MAAAREDAALPLLPRSKAETGGDENVPSWWWRQWLREAGRVGYLALPMLMVSLAQYAVQVASNMMVGHLPGVLPLSSAAMATSLATVSGSSVLIGLAGALETLCGQAYGAKQYHKVGEHTYRAIFTLLVFCIPLSILWVFMGNILVLLGQDPLIAEGAGRYMVWLIPGLFANAVIQPITKFLQTQSLIYALLLSSVATMAIHIPLCYVIVFKTGFGYTGAALSVSISYWLNVFMLVGYIVLSSSCKETRTCPTIEAFKGVDVFLRLALPSALMICLEWWSYELLILMSGLLPNPELQTSVLSICLTSIALLYTIPTGIGAAGSTRVANELGAGNPEGARSAVRVVMSMALMDAVIVSGTLLAARHLVGRAYSSEEEVISFVASMLPLVCISVVTDGLQGVLAGIARGCGWQHLGAYVNLGSFYLLGIPMAILLGFVLNMGARGLWIGVVCGSVTQTTLMAAITFCTDWPKMAEKARERVFSEKPAEPGSRSLLEQL
ncbi:protein DETOXIFICATION 12-like [Phragmites australis]|uniref:protein DETOXIFICATION 12-like n=1 Tax=Phragmites australis TaxID=29695 RepID=UPI002D78C809|nr:protein DETOXIFICATION 12-like [Phragmites australis]